MFGMDLHLDHHLGDCTSAFIMILRMLPFNSSPAYLEFQKQVKDDGKATELPFGRHGTPNMDRVHGPLPAAGGHVLRLKPDKNNNSVLTFRQFDTNYIVPSICVLAIRVYINI